MHHKLVARLADTEGSSCLAGLVADLCLHQDQGVKKIEKRPSIHGNPCRQADNQSHVTSCQESIDANHAGMDKSYRVKMPSRMLKLGFASCRVDKEMLKVLVDMQAQAILYHAV